jgi:aminodeoxyfutalosine deaminase
VLPARCPQTTPRCSKPNLTADYAAASQLGLSAQDCYQAGLRGALCDQQTKGALKQIGEAYDWAGLGDLAG